MFKILILSNGHGEDLSGSLIAKQFLKSGYSVNALPIVGKGNHYSKEKIKIIRKTKEGIKIFKVDLSTIDGIQHGNMIMQSHDIIYIQPNINIIPEIMEDLNPILSFASTISFLWIALTQFNP